MLDGAKNFSKLHAELDDVETYLSAESDGFKTHQIDSDLARARKFLEDRGIGALPAIHREDAARLMAEFS